MAEFKVKMRTLPPQFLMIISFLYQLLLIIRDPILLGGLKNGDKALYVGHKLWFELVMIHSDLILWECWCGQRKELVLPLQCLYLIFWGDGGKNPSLLIPSCRSQKHGGGDTRLASGGSLVVGVIGRGVDYTYFILCSNACHCIWNYEINLWACTKQAHQSWKWGEGGW